MGGHQHLLVIWQAQTCKKAVTPVDCYQCKPCSMALSLPPHDCSMHAEHLLQIPVVLQGHILGSLHEFMKLISFM